ncbi:adenosylcobalamin-dependent ribonucleoside-diphosphate reductase [Vibrio sp. CAU 1672]|uniref:adenosylcobalamin-dependent ribonucleoside-diphosphate reductase n=1 Tax=Vibrio sp. CAU 1672 TaxID=3032594 RepID=UPI0023DC13B8|nr:adenosylcobalamin-dependent ribonucleoside-diphosphate reductase [Vibrio sp. CAU 1672]MDF2155179.1 adenosylcobalamin-dependent ribonucleoside-diphosphate reductase [Vibrio sp. CAU 1672]
MTIAEFDPNQLSPISTKVWESKYRLYTDSIKETAIEHSWQRVADALAGPEKQQAYWRRQFFQALSDWSVLPAGRILAGAGAENHRVTLLNCFVMGVIRNSMSGISRSLRQSAITLQQGGGIGLDFSSLQPAGSSTLHQGPVALLQIWNELCAALVAGDSRRGAMLASLRCDHPDIEAFVRAKSQAERLTYFNLSVQISDDFMRAVEEDTGWALCFPPGGATGPIIKARDLWELILQSAYESGEPGVLFVDSINRANNLAYCEHLTTTNPCGEVPLPPFGACDLGSINLSQLVSRPFSEASAFQWQRLEPICNTAIRILDNVLEISNFPLRQQRRCTLQSRRVGLGITGLADCLQMLGLAYESPEARQFATELMTRIRDAAYAASVDLAGEKGCFPCFDKKAYLRSAYIRSLPMSLQQAIGQQGIRNSHLLAIAPAGSISLLANNVCSGIEPMFSPGYWRHISFAGQQESLWLEPYGVQLWRYLKPGKALPDTMVAASDLSPKAHLEMQACLQPLVDNAIAKTINVRADLPFARFRDVYRQAFQLGLKGVTVYRPNPVRPNVLEPGQGCNQSVC